MGGTTFESYAWGKTPQEAFRNAVEEAAYECGHGGYTGTIAEKDDFTVISVPANWKGKEEEYAYHLIQEDDPRIDDKWGPAGCILLESKDSVNKVPYATTQERYDQKGARKWETRFKVVSRDGVVTTKDSQTEAEKFAKEWVKSHNQSVKIHIVKELVNGSQDIVTFHPKTKDVKVKNGMNKYLFFGWASC